MTTTVITDAGIAKAIAAGSGGPLIKVTHFKFGSDIITGTISSAMTDVSGEVYVGNNSQITYSKVDDSNFVYMISVDDTVGDFNVGNIGLFLEDGTMFAIAALVSTSPKIKDNPPQIGNFKDYEVHVRLDGQANITDLTILTAADAKLPEVATESSLPSPDSAFFPVYFVRNHMTYGTPAIAARFASRWWLTLLSDKPDQQGVAIDINTWDNDNVDPGMHVYRNAVSGKLELGDGTDDAKLPIGLRGSNNELVANGMYIHHEPMFTAGQHYFAGPEGTLVTATTKVYVGFAVSTTHLLVSLDMRQAQEATAVTWNTLQDKPNTISGFGITDAYTKGEVEALVASSGGGGGGGIGGGLFNRTLTDIAQGRITNSDDVKYTVPAGKMLILTSVHITNLVETEIKVNIKGTDDNGAYYVTYTVPVTPNSSVEACKRPKILKAGTTISVFCDTANGADFALAGMLISTTTDYFGGHASPSSTAAVDLRVASTNGDMIKSMLLTNLSTNAAAMSLFITNGTTTVYWAKEHVVPAGATVEIAEHDKILPAGYTLKAQAYAGNTLSVVFAGATLP